MNVVLSLAPILLRVLALAGLSLGLLALVGGVIRNVPKRIGPFEFEQMGRSAALGLAHDLLWAAMDARFGFPTGYFEVDETRSSRDRVVARERIFKGTDAKSMLITVGTKPLEWGRNWRGNAAVAGPILGFVLLVIVLPFVLWAMAAEFVMRRVLRSEITAELADLGDGRFGTSATLTLRGPSARLAAKRLAAAFSPPRLPFKVASRAKSAISKETAKRG